jgi:hypothetical protein
MKIKLCFSERLARRKIRLIEGNAKCRHIKNLPVKGLCVRCLSEFIDSQSCFYFRPSLVNCCPSKLLSGSTPPRSPPPPPTTPPFSVSQYIVYRHCVAVRGWGCGGVLSPVGDHILQEFNSLCLTIFRTYKTARPPKTKT